MQDEKISQNFYDAGTIANSTTFLILGSIAQPTVWPPVLMINTIYEKIHAELMQQLTMRQIKKKRKLKKIIPFEIQNFTPVTKACSAFFVSNYKVCWCTYIPLEYGLASQHKISFFYHRNMH